ncbi:MAG TPA: hypothetical protein VHA82_20025 [Ramlibacter sp.]|uniref:DUF7660 family protein n=1 Tax=Ramlibacter sp. TaxID=1917967 RepID=UPI002BBBD728|nr:hypothetical protein [Ramlibacter sp.]HVZ46105.1 hypothetical protein [Ramlibacter sp.]
MTNDDLYDYAGKVNSRADFVQFVQHLNEDRRAHNPEWENGTLDQFLSGLSAFANDMGGYYRNMGETVDIEHITWRMVAQMLLAATVYGN